MKFEYNVHMQIIDQTIQNVFQTKQYSLTKLDKGISNHNYLLCVNQKKYIVRAPKSEHSALHLQFEKEKEVLLHVKNLDVETLYFDTINGIKITNFVPHISEFHETADPKKYAKAALLLKKLHTKNVEVSFFFDPFFKLEQYKNAIKSPIIHFDQEEKILNAVKEIYIPDTLCHNDVVQGNILFSPQREYLIDWEYGAMNDRRFDIASFFSENQIMDPKSRNQFYEAYHLPISNTEVCLFEAMADILWGYWGNMLYEKRKELIYKQIATEKMEHYHHFSLHSLSSFIHTL